MKADRAIKSAGMLDVEVIEHAGALSIEANFDETRYPSALVAAWLDRVTHEFDPNPTGGSR